MDGVKVRVYTYLAVNSTVPPLPAEGSVPPSVRPEVAAGVPNAVLMAAAATSLWRRETRCWTSGGGRSEATSDKEDEGHGL